MLIEQIIEFELRGRGAPCRTCTPATDYFRVKAKISKEFFRVDYYLQLKYCWRQCTYFPLTGPYFLQNLTPKCKILNVFWT